MKIHDVKQGSPEWLKLRCGIPTASEFNEMLTSSMGVRTGATVDKYLYRKLAERLLGFPLHDASSWAMEQGAIMEHEAIPFFEGVYDVEVRRVGFITTDDGRLGCSPDGLIGDDDGLEVKCPQPQTHLRYLCEGGVPTEYMAQVHGAMLITGRPRWTFMSYSRQFPPLVVKVERDEEIQKALMKSTADFLIRFDGKFAKVRAMKDALNAAKNEAYYASNPEKDK